jgi:uroporphyrin-3 C-methyltransferase
MAQYERAYMSEPQTENLTPAKPTLADTFARVTLTQLTLAVLVIIFVWQWLAAHNDINVMQEQLAKKIAEMDGSNKANSVLLAKTQEDTRELASKLTLLETRYAESQGQRATLEALYNDLSSSRDEMALAEVEQLLLIASQQLQLSANVKAALIAMQAADARLQRMGRPALNGLRKTIGQDMDKLRALPNVDVEGMSFQLDTLIAAADELPLIYQQRSADEAAPAAANGNASTWQKLWREIWQEVKQLVRIQNTGKAELPLLPPEQEFFLRENLKLRLLLARVDLLSRDEVAFKAEIHTVQEWLRRYFDVKSGNGQHMLDSLKKLGAASINIELPDINPSLAQVRSYRMSRESKAENNLRAKAAR